MQNRSAIRQVLERVESLALTGIALLVVAGCGENLNSGVAPTVTDLSVGLAADQLPPGWCTDDSSCAKPTPRCDAGTHRCVACLPQNDNCGNGERCLQRNGTYLCTSGCNVDADCPRSDAGTAASCCSGACVDTRIDVLHCGGCASPCKPIPGAAPACVGGLCVVGTCEPDRLDCDAIAANGCEVSLLLDDGNCGACGNKCALGNAASHCQGGACGVSSCNPGFGDCNQLAMDGCETDLTMDAAHCGGCNRACVVANGVGACKAGSCAVAGCNPGFADCNGVVMDGCEVAIAQDASNCGACGKVCGGPNSTQGCQMGACHIDSCSKGFEDCDKKVETGCEVDLGSSLMNCGGCGKICGAPQNGNASCVGGVCGLKGCQPGFADCNMKALDGCEVDLGGVGNCGGCGKACVGPANTEVSCNGGMCAVGGCVKGFFDCDMNPNNGCEPRPCPGCANGIKDGDESDVDCGGLRCEPCKKGQQCVANRDCDSLTCNALCCQITFVCDIFGCIPICSRPCNTCN